MKDTFFLKLSGSANIPSELEIDKIYTIESQCAVTDIRRKSNDNGEYDVTFVAKPFQIEVVKESGERIKAKDIRHNSVLIRNMLWKEHNREGYTEDFDRCYDEAALVICGMVQGIMREAVKRIQAR